MDSKNADLFIHNQASLYYDIKFADNVAADYSYVNGNQKDLVLTMWNLNAFTGQNVNVHVVSFSVRKRLAMEE